MLKKMRVRRALRRAGQDRCRCGGRAKVTIHRRSRAISVACRRCSAPLARWNRWR